MYRIIFENWTIDDAVKEMKQGVTVIILFGRTLTDYLHLNKMDSTATVESILDILSGIFNLVNVGLTVPSQSPTLISCLNLNQK